MISSLCLRRASIALFSVLLVGLHPIASAQTNQARLSGVGSIESRLNLNALNSQTFSPFLLSPSRSKDISASSMQIPDTPQRSFTEKGLGAGHAHSLLPAEQTSLHNLLVLPPDQLSLKDIAAIKPKHLQLSPANVNGQTTNKDFD
jgi:hypothetical protein